MIKIINDNYRKKGEKLLDCILAEVKNSFSIDYAQKKLGLPRGHVIQILARLKRNGKIIALSRGLYAPLSPIEKNSRMEIIRILDGIMKHRHTPYYVGLLSAADYYGAAHYKPQILQVMIPKYISFRKAKSLGISFHVQKHFAKIGVDQIKTPYGYVNYASPELLALDLIEYESASGGFDNIVLVIKELMPHFNPSKFKKIAMEYPVMASVQRLGYIVEALNGPKPLLRELTQVKKMRGGSVIKLSSVLAKKGPYESKWQIIKNSDLESLDDF